MNGRDRQTPHERRLQLVVRILAVVLVVIATVNLVSTLAFRREVNYNEGWNIFNALRFTLRQPLYPPAFSYTSNNYPLASFALMSFAHRITHDYLYTARALSVLGLLLICCLVVRICLLLQCTHLASRTAGLFCYLLFIINTTGDYASTLYIGAADPTMLGLAVATTGLYLYLLAQDRPRPAPLLIAAAAAFALSLSIKQTFLDIPAIAILDLGLRQRRRSLALLLALSACLALSFGLQNRLAGPGFIAQLTAPRTYANGRSLETFLNVFGPLLLPALAAGIGAFTLLKDPRLRIASLLLAGGVLLGLVTGRAEGVSYNCFFTSYVALSILLGISLARLSQRLHAARLQHAHLWFAITLFAWFLVPLVLFRTWNPVRTLIQAREDERVFNQQVQLIAASRGPALCESLLRCYLAGKPYLYDPFNSTRLINLGLLDPKDLLTAVQHRSFAVVQLSDPVDVELSYRSEHFTPPVLAALQQNYTQAYRHGRETIYRPR